MDWKALTAFAVAGCLIIWVIGQLARLGPTLDLADAERELRVIRGELILSRMETIAARERVAEALRADTAAQIAASDAAERTRTAEARAASSRRIVDTVQVTDRADALLAALLDAEDLAEALRGEVAVHRGRADSLSNALERAGRGLSTAADALDKGAHDVEQVADRLPRHRLSGTVRVIQMIDAPTQMMAGLRSGVLEVGGRLALGEAPRAYAAVSLDFRIF
jgi:hypothetical protein